MTNARSYEPTVADDLRAGLIALGYQFVGYVPDKSGQQFAVFTRGNMTNRIFLGVNGSLQVGVKITSSQKIQDGFRKRLLRVAELANKVDIRTL